MKVDNPAPTVYSVDQVPLTPTIKGAGAEIAFQAKTRTAPNFSLTAKCPGVQQM